MRRRMISDKKADAYISRMIDSIIGAKYEYEKTWRWPIFLNYFDLKEALNYYVGANALVINALSSCGTLKYEDIIDEAYDSLLKFWNSDGSWPAYLRKGNEGVIYDTVMSTIAILNGGFLDINKIGSERLENNVNSIMKTVSWLYGRKIIYDDNKPSIYGWGYTDNMQNEIYIMPTCQTLVCLKKIRTELAKIWKTKISEPIIEGKSLQEIIFEIENSILYFKTPQNAGWGKKVREDSLLVNTCYAVYALIVDENNNNMALQPEHIKQIVPFILSASKKEPLSEEVFDSFVCGSDFKVIDHENFLESILLISMCTLVGNRLRDIPNHYQKSIYSLIEKNMESFEKRMEDVCISEKVTTVVRSRRGLLSQVYPLYAITGMIEALNSVKNNRKELTKLLRVKRIIRNIILYIVQVFCLGFINKVTMSSATVGQILFVSMVAPILDILKKIVKDNDDKLID